MRIPSGASSGASARDRLVDRADRLVAGAVVVGARADEREHLVRVGDGDRAVAELLEQLVGDRARGALGQAAAQLGQRRLEQLEHRRLAPRPAHARHLHAFAILTAVPYAQISVHVLPISDVSKRIATIAFPPFASASSRHAARSTSSRLCREHLRHAPQLAAEHRLQAGADLRAALRERTVRPKTSP